MVAWKGVGNLVALAAFYSSLSNSIPLSLPLSHLDSAALPPMERVESVLEKVLEIFRLWFYAKERESVCVGACVSERWTNV